MIGIASVMRHQMHQIFQPFHSARDCQSGISKKMLGQKVCKICCNPVRNEYLIPSAICKNASLSTLKQSFALSISSIYSNTLLGGNPLLVALLLENGRKTKEKKILWTTFPPVQPHLAAFLRKTWCTHKVMVASCYMNVEQPDSKGYTITLFKCYPGNNLSLGRRCILIQETKFKSLGITSWSCLPFCLNSFNKTLALTLGCTKSKYDLCFLLIISSEGTL